MKFLILLLLFPLNLFAASTATPSVTATRTYTPQATFTATPTPNITGQRTVTWAPLTATGYVLSRSINGGPYLPIASGDVHAFSNKASTYKYAFTEAADGTLSYVDVKIDPNAVILYKVAGFKAGGK